MNRVATYKELDSDLFKHAAFATLDDMNLRLLTKRLNLEADVKEVMMTLFYMSFFFFPSFKNVNSLIIDFPA